MTSWSLGLGHLFGLVPEFSHGLHLDFPVPGTLDIWINFNAEICGAEVCCITAPGTSTEPTDWMTPPARAETLPGPVLPGSGEIRATSQWSPKNRRKIGQTNWTLWFFGALRFQLSKPTLEEIWRLFFFEAQEISTKTMSNHVQIH